jgi:rhodanese-related sulfurtransferase
MQKNAVLIVDVRMSDEINLWIPGSIHIPLRDLAGKIEEIRRRCEQMKPVFVCQSGVRSRLAATIALEIGCMDSSSLSGGFEAWQASGLSAAPK